MATIGHKGALGVQPSYWRQHLQALITCLICLATPGHQKCSCNRERVQSWPWCPASQWHPCVKQQFDALWVQRIVTDPHSPLLGWSASRGYLRREVKFWQFLHTIQPSLLIILSPRSFLRSAFFLDPSHCRTVSSSGILFLSCCPIGDMHFYQDSPSSNLLFLFQPLVTFQ